MVTRPFTQPTNPLYPARLGTAAGPAPSGLSSVAGASFSVGQVTDYVFVEVERLFLAALSAHGVAPVSVWMAEHDAAWWVFTEVAGDNAILDLVAQAELDFEDQMKRSALPRADLPIIFQHLTLDDDRREEREEILSYPRYLRIPLR